MKSAKIRTDFEVLVFRFSMAAAFLFELVQLIHKALIDAPKSLLKFDFISLTLILVVFETHKKFYNLSIILFYLYGLFTAWYLWDLTGGWQGSMPYTLVVLLVLIIITSHGWTQILLLFTAWLLILLLLVAPLKEILDYPESYAPLALSLNFLINTITLLIISIYLKLKFYQHKSSIEGTNSQLENSSYTLEKQAEQLQAQQEKLNSMTNNLQQLVSERVKEVQNKSDKIKEYAYVNAHRIRGPLARVLGLIYILELEQPNHPQLKLLKEIKEEAEKMEKITSKITEVTN